jgi:O-antigen/teichoic acid export membrane protein
MKKFFKSEIIRGGLSLFVLFNIFNFLGFLYQVLMAKTLGPEDYGVLAVLFSLFYFIAIPSEIIQTTASKYTSKFKVKNEYGMIKKLLISFLSNGFLISLLVFILALPLFYWYSEFVHVELSLIVLMGIMIFPSFLSPVSRGILQGMKKFNSLGINMVIDAFIKLSVALLLVYFGFRVYGAIIGTLLGAVVGLVFSFLPLKKIIYTKKEDRNIPNILSYTSPVFFAMIAIMFVQSIDIILAKRFFNSNLAGQYAAANLVGKMIFLGTISIAKVLLPISSEKHESGRNSISSFMKSFFAIIILCIIATIFVVGLQDVFINIIFGSQYFEIRNILLNLCIAFSLISISNLVLIYGISINKKIRAWHVIIFCSAQIGLLYTFNQNLVLFSMAMILTSALFLTGSLLIVFGKPIK